jgi:HD-GYP domain-containing protein (c-di-GMP phosphodiesterase class II)
MENIVSRLEQLIDIGIALSSEATPAHLLEQILTSARSITNSDGGTLYSVKDNLIKIEILQNESLNMKYGGSSSSENFLPTIALYRPNGSPNVSNVVTYAVHNNTTVNIADSYDSENFDFSGTRSFDGKMGYRSVSFLTVPLRNHEKSIIGVLQLINSRDKATNKTVPFDHINQRLIEALASQAAISLTKEQLIDGMKKLFEAMIKLIADAIDKKSPYTGGHCRRVPEITMMLAEAAHLENEGIFKNFNLSDEDKYELEIAAWLHDCGKIIIPEHVVDKATKLQTIFDRIELIQLRYEILCRDLEIEALKSRVHELEKNHILDLQSQEILKKTDDKKNRDLAGIIDDLEFLRKCNSGSEFMSSNDQTRVKSIANRAIIINGNAEPMLSSNEVYNLSISRGTLNAEEREIINSHINVTLDMLHSLPFPKQLKRVPEFAGGHHERMDGKGYPKGLTQNQLSLQARIIGIADVFEALTAKDRPYKPGKKLSESLKIMSQMSKEGHLDQDLFQLFLSSRIYLKYSEKFLDPKQIDEVHIEDYFDLSRAA